LKRAREQPQTLVTAPKTVLGYYGCTAETAKRILAEERFVISTNTYDWLGEGAYFGEYAPYRALEWATQRCEGSGGEPAVVGATIRLGRCLNLLDIEHTSGVSLAYNYRWPTTSLPRIWEHAGCPRIRRSERIFWIGR